MDNLVADTTQVRRKDTNVRRRLNQKGINKDVAMKIFSKLCVKDLVRFKCVSKYWDRIISDPMLSKLYINPKATANTFLFLDLQNGEAKVSWLFYGHYFRAVTLEGREVPLPDEIGPTARVLGYVDGLICISGDPGEILLYNPCTRECRVLTLPRGCPGRRALVSSSSVDHEEKGGLEIADKKERSSRSGVIDVKEYETCSKLARPGKDMSRLEIGDKREMFGDASGVRVRVRPQMIYLGGIGYDWKTCDYKVVAIFFDSYNSTENNKVMVFPLRENSWREVRGGSGFPYLPWGNDTHRVPVNGAIHWFVRDQNNQARVIISFDLSTEEVREVPAPDDHVDYATATKDAYCKSDLVSLDGRLGVILHNQYDERRNFYIHVWLMEEYGVGASWRQVQLCVGFSGRPGDGSEVRLDKAISCWKGPVFVCMNGEVLVGNAVGMYWYWLKESCHEHCIITPMGFRNTMLAFQASPASPFGGLLA